MDKRKQRPGSRAEKPKKTDDAFFTHLGDAIIPLDVSEQGPEGWRKAIQALSTYIVRLSSSPRKDAVTDHELVRARLHRGVALVLLGEWQTGMEDFIQIIQLEPGTAEAHTASLFLALAYDISSEQDQLAKEEWTRLLEMIEPQITLESESSSLMLAALAFVSRARLFARKAEYLQAIADCDRALTYDPACAEAYSLRGAVYGHLQQAARAIADCSKAIELAGWPVHYYRRALIYKRTGTYQRALDDMQRACQMEPENALFRQEHLIILMYWVGNHHSASEHASIVRS